MKNEPIMREESLRIQIALGAITALMILCMMLAFMITQSALADNQFEALHRDPGLFGIRMLVYVVPYYALIPVYVYCIGTFRLQVFRWIIVAIAGLGLVFWILHHLSHWRLGSRPDFNSHVMDLTLHVVGLWLLVSSIRWAKLPKLPLPVRDQDDASVANNIALQES
jgi:hypothetical protein